MSAPHPLEGLLYGQTDLARLCAERPLDWDEYAHMNEFHGNASVLKRHAGLPLDEPLPFAIEHAIPYDLDAAYEYDLNCGLPLFLTVHEQSAALYHDGPIPEVVPVGFTHLYALDLFARLHPEAAGMPRRGTIVFPDKSTLLMDTDFDRDAFAARLAALPEEFQPVVVCIYWRDALRGNHAAYARAGLPVVTCGHLRDGDFLLRFHDLCRRFRYACANDIAGSFALSILSGCHFFHLPGGPVTQRKHGRTCTYDHDPTLDKPQKAACLAASPFPPASPEAQLALAREFAGVSFKKAPQEIAELHARAQDVLRRATTPIDLALSSQMPLEPWHRLLPAGIDRDGWVRREARLRVARSPDVAAVRLTLDFRKPSSPGEALLELQVRVQDKPFATMKPPRFHREVLVPCDASAGETAIRLISSHALPLPGEPRERALRLSRVELLDVDALADARRKSAAAGTAKRSGKRARRKPLLRRIAEALFSGGMMAKSRTRAFDTGHVPPIPRPLDSPTASISKTLPQSANPMPTPTTDSLRTDLDGLRVKRPDHPAIYLVDGGFRRLIPNPETFRNLFLTWDGIITDVPLDDIPEGPCLSNGAALVRPADSQTVYLIDRGTKRAIAGEGVMARYHFNEQKVTVVPPILMGLIPTGKPLTAPEANACQHFLPGDVRPETVTL